MRRSPRYEENAAISYDGYRKGSNEVKELIIAKLEQQVEDNRCSCGDICQAYDNGFQDAIDAIKNM